MNCKFTNVIVFAVGAAIGSAVTWKIVKDRYDRLVKEEIESVKEAFAKIDQDDQEQSDDITDDESVHQINWEEFEDLQEEEDDTPTEMKEYSKLASMYTNEKGGAESMTEKPVVISPYDFGELDGYNQVELTYYADGILEDEDYNIISPNEIDKLIGSDSLYTFGEYEEDSVCVRNKTLRTDFQILRDYRTYAEVRSTSPNQVDD